jgi:uncharacterized membrane-anchored protein
MKQNVLQNKHHPSRDQLYAEIHSRPFPLVTSSVHALHFAFITSRKEALQQYEILKLHANENNISVSEVMSNCLYLKFPEYEFRWEMHQEFCSLTIIQKINSIQPFQNNFLRPEFSTLLEQLPGELVVALQIHLERDKQQPPVTELPEYFEHAQLYGSSIVGGKATMWSSFRLHSDDFARMLIYDTGLSDYQAGRTLQRVIEVETYLRLSLLSLPVARSLMPKISKLRSKLSNLIKKMQSSVNNGLDEQALLEQLSEYAAQIEDYRSATTHRFSATNAYSDLVGQRLEDLREVSWPGYSSWKKMLQRRLLPAVETCSSVNTQLHNLSEHAERASNLLRTRVDMKIAAQNQMLLQSLDRRSELQLRLQQTVEGLSVVAISYYLVSLIKLVAEGIEKMGVNINPGIVAAAFSVPVLIGTALIIRRVRYKINKPDTK